MYRLLEVARADGRLTWRVGLDQLAQQLPLAQRYPSHLQRVLQPAGSASHASIAAELKLRSSKEAANLLITAKRLFTRMLRLVVGEYAGAEQQIDEEIDDLMRILCGHR